ncbi:UrcA family protein [Tsuneonella mangrovi]|uniref:UrcA family protein n=1 Tax=Tsuneonella mangrovi TaxID=1982042 RepID=UPI00123709D3|nr:UrcA family protein [Tsuneonella mangrovi]
MASFPFRGTFVGCGIERNLAMLRTTAFLGLALVAVASPVMAQKPVKVPVRYEDLDISTPQGQAAFDNRIDEAVRNVCGADVWMNAKEYFDIDHCMKAAYADARAQRQAAIARRMERRPTVTIVALRSKP